MSNSIQSYVGIHTPFRIGFDNNIGLSIEKSNKLLLKMTVKKGVGIMIINIFFMKMSSSSTETICSGIVLFSFFVWTCFQSWSSVSSLQCSSLSSSLFKSRWSLVVIIMTALVTHKKLFYSVVLILRHNARHCCLRQGKKLECVRKKEKIRQ